MEPHARSPDASPSRPRRQSMLNFVLAALLLGPATVAQAQDSVVAGVVLGATTGDPLEGARLTVEGTPLVQTTDAKGQFRFANLTSAEVTLQVARIGYQPAAVVARLGQTNLRVLLRGSTVRLDEIVVTGQPQGTERRAVG